MENQVVLITGAQGGLGTFVTQTFLGAGAQVVATARHIEPVDHPNFTGIPADLLERSQVDALIAATMAKFQKIDALIHVAGGFAGGTPIHETDDETWEKMLHVNLKAAMNVLR